MKILLFFIPLVLIINSVSYSQLSQGSFLIGGGFNIQNSTSDYSYGYGNDSPYKNKSKSFEFNIQPNVGYFFLNNIALGIMGNIGNRNYQSYTSLSSTIDNSNGNTFSYGVGIFFRYYYPINDFAFIGKFNYSFTWSNGTSKYKGSDYFGEEIYEIHSNGNTLTPGLGITYFLNKYISLEGFLQYQINNSKISQKYIKSIYPMENYHTDSTNKNFSFLVGFQIYLPND